MKPINKVSSDEIFTNIIATPIGKMVACSTGRGICLLEFAKGDSPSIDDDTLKLKPGRKLVAGENRHLEQVKMELEEYFSGKRTGFDVPLHLIGTDFQMAVWKSLSKIPFGTTTTYLKQAISLGKEKAIRAVAAANGQNKIAIIIPCHRVIGTNGRLTGYAGGIERKKWLLEHEQKQPEVPNRLLFDALTWNDLQNLCAKES